MPSDTDVHQRYRPPQTEIGSEPPRRPLLLADPHASRSLLFFLLGINAMILVQLLAALLPIDVADVQTMAASAAALFGGAFALASLLLGARALGRCPIMWLWMPAAFAIAAMAVLVFLMGLARIG